jgi:hypothetical protein
MFRHEILKLADGVSTPKIFETHPLISISDSLRGEFLAWCADEDENPIGVGIFARLKETLDCARKGELPKWYDTMIEDVYEAQMNTYCTLRFKKFGDAVEDDADSADSSPEGIDDGEVQRPKLSHVVELFKRGKLKDSKNKKFGKQPN